RELRDYPERLLRVTGAEVLALARRALRREGRVVGVSRPAGSGRAVGRTSATAASERATERARRGRVAWRRGRPGAGPPPAPARPGPRPPPPPFDRAPSARGPADRSSERAPRPRPPATRSAGVGAHALRRCRTRRGAGGEGRARRARRRSPRRGHAALHREGD